MLQQTNGALDGNRVSCFHWFYTLFSILSSQSSFDIFWFPQSLRDFATRRFIVCGDCRVVNARSGEVSLINPGERLTFGNCDPRLYLPRGCHRSMDGPRTARSRSRRAHLRIWRHFLPSTRQSPRSVPSSIFITSPTHFFLSAGRSRQHLHTYWNL